MAEQKALNAQEKLAATSKLLDFMDSALPDCHPQDRLEVLILAYHASTSTQELRLLVGGAS